MSNYKIIDRSSGNVGDVEPILGKPLEYDEGFDVESGPLNNEEWENFNDEYKTPGKAAQRGIDLGLPKFIRGDPLGCGCGIAYLHAVGEVVNGQVEADYMCDSGWHNFVVMQVKTKEKKREVKIDKFGLVVGDEGHKFNGLEEY